MSAVAAALLAAGCAEAPARPSGAAASPSPAGSPALTQAPTGAATATRPAAPAPAGRTISVTVRDGRTVDTPARVDVRAGEPVRLVVTSDAADEIHVHGVDQVLELRPGRTASLDFTPRQTGSFEVELHEADLLLFQLRVR